MNRRQLLFAGTALALLPTLARAACTVTQSDSLGPFFVAGAPEQSDMCATAGDSERLTVSGRILGAPDCTPLAGALVEVWQADPKGEYSQVSRSRRDDPRCLLRASVKTDARGTYVFRTLLPGIYPGRPAHIHYRVSMNGYRPLTTQLYFGPERGVDAQRIVKPVRRAKTDGTPGDYQASFDVTLQKP